MLLEKGIGKPIHDELVKVISTQLGVTVCGLHIEDTIRDPKERNIKGASTQIENENTTNSTAIKAIGKGSSRGLIENPFH